jgi:hypothetical protein
MIANVRGSGGRKTAHLAVQRDHHGQYDDLPPDGEGAEKCDPRHFIVAVQTIKNFAIRPASGEHFAAAAAATYDGSNVSSSAWAKGTR